MQGQQINQFRKEFAIPAGLSESEMQMLLALQTRRQVNETSFSVWYHAMRSIASKVRTPRPQGENEEVPGFIFHTALVYPHHPVVAGLRGASDIQGITNIMAVEGQVSSPQIRIKPTTLIVELLNRVINGRPKSSY